MEELLVPQAPPRPELLPVVRQILAGRGVSEPAALATFLYPDYSKHLNDPFAMLGMKAAVERIIKAAEAKERVVVYGDYDIDGLTATAVMLETLRAVGIEATPYIPDRFDEGYGINQAALEAIKAAGADLVITVDCGVTAVAEGQWAANNGLDLIITDHHTVPAKLPQAVAILNPKQPYDPYPFKELAGVGVAFKLAQALQARTGRPAEGREKWLLDLVALGTVCDVVPLVDENRVLAKFGLKVLHQTRRPGLRALAAISGVSIGQLASSHLGFAFGPRLNAAGRLEHASKALELLTTSDANQALKIAEELNLLNRRRQADQAIIMSQATKRAGEYGDDAVLVLADPEWSHGIIGIAAGRLADSLRRPVVLLQVIDDIAKGSARSFGGFDLMPAWEAASDLFIKAGGHRFAAGCTLPAGKVDEFRQRLNQHAAKASRTQAEAPEAETYPVDNLAEIDWALLEQLDWLEPYGNANPAPVFLSRVRPASWRTVGADGQHLKLTLSSGLDCIGFGLGKHAATLHPEREVDITYYVERNEFNGRTSLQLRLRSLQ